MRRLASTPAEGFHGPSYTQGALAFFHIDTFLTPTANAVKIEVTWLRILVLGTRRRGVPLEVDDPLDGVSRVGRPRKAKPVKEAGTYRTRVLAKQVGPLSR